MLSAAVAATAALIEHDQRVRQTRVSARNEAAFPPVFFETMQTLSAPRDPGIFSVPTFRNAIRRNARQKSVEVQQLIHDVDD